MENHNEIIEAEVELQNGKTRTLQIQEVDQMDWNEIPKGTTALAQLFNGQLLLIEIVRCDYEGVSFKTEGSKYTLHYEESAISSLFVEVKQDNTEQDETLD